MSSVGVNATTGKIMLGWAHVVQSIGKILTTEIGSRVERRDFGSIIPRLIDQPENEENIVNFFLSAAEALEPRFVRGNQYGEPRFVVSNFGFSADIPGDVVLEVTGDYLPNGHLGDTSRASPRRVTYSANRVSDQFSFEAI